jgi:putative tryptophan/tyrosine transport system substrate-binding protein
VAPHLARVVLVFNPDTAPYATLFARAAHEAGERLALEVAATGMSDADAIEPAIAAVARRGDGGLVSLPDAFTFVNRATTIALAAKYRVPAIYNARHFSAAGGLMSYGPDTMRQFRDGATYVDRILRGARPGDLPVQLSTKFELALNLKTAKQLGLEIPQKLLATADEVIQ